MLRGKGHPSHKNLLCGSQERASAGGQAGEGGGLAPRGEQVPAKPRALLLCTAWK